ncbi:hypothetical protein IT575_01805 [bacterium]|nr:hypothetical protein [bacterium]
MNSHKNIRNLGLSAIIAAAVAFSLGISNQPQAADNQNSSRSNNGSPSDSASPPSTEELSETMSQIDSLISQIEDGLTQASSLQAQLSEQSSLLSEARAASSEGNEEMLTQIEEARRAFETSVAPLLDPATVEQVSLNFTKIEFEYKPQREASEDDGMDDEIEELSSSISAALSALESLKAGSSELTSTYDLKAAKK